MKAQNKFFELYGSLHVVTRMVEDMCDDSGRLKTVTKEKQKQLKNICRECSKLSKEFHDRN